VKSMGKKKEALLVNNQEWLDDFIPALVEEMTKLGYTGRGIGEFLAEIFWALREIKTN